MVYQHRNDRREAGTVGLGDNLLCAGPSLILHANALENHEQPLFGDH